MRAVEKAFRTMFRTSSKQSSRSFKKKIFSTNFSFRCILLAFNHEKEVVAAFLFLATFTITKLKSVITEVRMSICLLSLKHSPEKRGHNEPQLFRSSTYLFFLEKSNCSLRQFWNSLYLLLLVLRRNLEKLVERLWLLIPLVLASERKSELFVVRSLMAKNIASESRKRRKADFNFRIHS